MQRIARVLALLPLVALVAPISAQEGTFRVVVRDDNPVRELTSAEVSDLFLRKTMSWDDGTPVLPVDRRRGAEIVDIFSKAVHRKSASAIESYWSRQVFSGEGVPPTRVGSDREVLEYVSRNRGAIGYVSAEAQRPEGVRSLRISDVETLADREPWWQTGGAEPETEIVAARGSLRLILTGSCGPGGEGREAILLNLDRSAPNYAEVETSRWNDGTFRASSRRGFTLSGGEEKRLGCDRIGGGLELRYALAAVADNSLAIDPRRALRGPPRDFIAFAESATCGRKAEGMRITVVNRHPQRSIRVKIETVEKVAGTFRGRSTKTYRLGPGDEKQLGCSRDGNLEHEYHLVEAD